MAPRKKKARAAPRRKPARKPARKKRSSRKSPLSVVRARAVDENGTYFGASYADSDLLKAEDVRKRLKSEGIELPTDWDGIRDFYITHPEFSAHRIAVVCRRDWRHFWQRMKDEGWARERSEFQQVLEAETLGQVVKMRAEKKARTLGKALDELDETMLALLARNRADLESGQRPPSSPIQIEIVERFFEMMGVRGGLCGISERGGSAAAQRSRVGSDEEQPDEPIDQARRAWEAQQAMWATELGHDSGESTPESGADSG